MQTLPGLVQCTGTRSVSASVISVLAGMLFIQVVEQEASSFPYRPLGLSLTDWWGRWDPDGVAAGCGEALIESHDPDPRGLLWSSRRALPLHYAESAMLPGAHGAQRGPLLPHPWLGSRLHVHCRSWGPGREVRREVSPHPLACPSSTC